MHIQPLASTRSDNYFYLLHTDSGTGTKEAILIDPIDAQVALDAVAAQGLELKMVVNTHWHPDHVGGNQQVLEAHPNATLAIPALEQDHISGGDTLLHDGDTISLGEEELQVILAPGHTHGHICLRHKHHLFSGDVIFVAGAGNTRFGGDPSKLYQSFRDVLHPLPDETIFYPGHNYARNNLAFCLNLEPDNEAARNFEAEIQGREGLILSTLGQEKTWSPFMRASAPSLQARLRQHHPEAWAAAGAKADDAERAFVAVRFLRNQW